MFDNFNTNTKIVGVTAENDKGTPIQILLSMLKSGDRLIFIREYKNPFDPNAIKVFSQSGQHIGYLSKELSTDISPLLDNDPTLNLEGVVTEVTGGTDGKLYGCNIRIWIQAPGEPTFEDIKFYQEEYRKRNQQPHSKNNIKTILLWSFIIVLSLVAFCGIFKMFGDNKSNKTSSFSKGSADVVDDRLITLNEYNQLKVGMSRSEVYNIIGSYGEKVSESSVDGYRVVMYSYDGYGSLGANAQLMFENGSLSTMAQYGLDYHFGSNTDNPNVSNSSNSSIANNITSSSATSSVNEEKPPIEMKDVYFDITILPPDIIETIWMEATYKNNSKYPITYLDATVLLKDTNEKVYLTSIDTVLPGETSPVFKTFGPKSLNSNDIDFLTCTFKIRNDSGDETYVSWDLKLGTYEIY